MIAFNVPPYNNDGVTSVQKWIPALTPEYHSIATSLDSQYVLSVNEGSGVTSITSKTYPFTNDVDKTISGSVKY